MTYQVTNSKCSTCEPITYNIPVGSTPFEISLITGLCLEEAIAIWELHQNEVCDTIYYSTSITQQVQKQCESGVGSFVTVTVDAGLFSSQTSQQEANSQALAYFATIAQDTANALGSCLEISPGYTPCVTKKCFSWQSFDPVQCKCIDNPCEDCPSIVEQLPGECAGQIESEQVCYRGQCVKKGSQCCESSTPTITPTSNGTPCSIGKCLNGQCSDKCQEPCVSSDWRNVPIDGLTFNEILDAGCKEERDARQCIAAECEDVGLEIRNKPNGRLCFGAAELDFVSGSNIVVQDETPTLSTCLSGKCINPGCVFEFSGNVFGIRDWLYQYPFSANSGDPRQQWVIVEFTPGGAHKFEILTYDNFVISTTGQIPKNNGNATGADLSFTGKTSSGDIQFLPFNPNQRFLSGTPLTGANSTDYYIGSTYPNYENRLTALNNGLSSVGRDLYPGINYSNSQLVWIATYEFVRSILTFRVTHLSGNPFCRIKISCY